MDLGTSLLLDTLAEGLGEPTPQRGEVTYARKVRSAEREIDWSRPSADIHRHVRIGDAWTTFRGRRLKVHRTSLVDSPPHRRWRRAMSNTPAARCWWVPVTVPWP